jgi:uncharacterized protein YbjT (DUF2867 family)
MNNTIIVAGSSGLVGRETVKHLILDSACSEIILLVRKTSEFSHPKVREILFDFTREKYELESVQADSMFICVGTTMKKAKTKETFKNVDLDIPVKLAKMALEKNIQNVSVISAMGANSHSAFFYNKVKGEMESQLISLNLPSLTIVRPSLLIGDREEFRLGERFAEKVYKAFPNIYPKKYQPIEASMVAKAMLKANSDPQDKKVKIIENKMIHELSVKS